MAESKRFERDPAEGSRSTVEKQLKDQQRSRSGESQGEANKDALKNPKGDASGRNMPTSG